jgi:hypothetical protein
MIVVLQAFSSVIHCPSSVSNSPMSIYVEVPFIAFSTNVGAQNLVAAEAFELALLNQTKQIGLESHRALEDLVEEDGAVIREFE